MTISKHVPARMPALVSLQVTTLKDSDSVTLSAFVCYLCVGIGLLHDYRMLYLHCRSFVGGSNLHLSRF